jgi:hypothetical protein
MTMNYGSAIPAHFNESFERAVLNYRSKQRDSMVARNLSTMRNVGATVQTDTITFYEKSGGNDKIDASIVAKGATPNQIGVKGKEVSHAMYCIATGFMMNGRDLALDPALQTRKVEVATADIRRREDYIWVNGDTGTGLTGLDYAAGVNPNGKVTASGASGNDVNNVGNWAGSDASIDIYADVLEAVTRIGDNFAPKFLLGRRTDLAPIRKLDDLRKSYADEILDLFGAANTASFLRYSLYCPSGYVYVVAQDMEFTEFVISEDLVVDTTFGKEAGDNYRVELREWCNPVEFGSNEGVVEISTL